MADSVKRDDMYHIFKSLTCDYVCSTLSDRKVLLIRIDQEYFVSLRQLFSDLNMESTLAKYPNKKMKLEIFTYLDTGFISCIKYTIDTDKPFVEDVVKHYESDPKRCGFTDFTTNRKIGISHMALYGGK